MKILVFTGGLGNQIFEYAFYCFLKQKFPKTKFYGNYRSKTKEHFGLELTKWFVVSLPPERWWVLPVCALFYFYKKINPKSKYLDLNQSEYKNKEAIILFPFKFSKAYIPKHKGWIEWDIKEEDLTDANKTVLKQIRNSNSCFIHIRRGDYLSPQYKSLFSNCCTIEYYSEAIRRIYLKCPETRFFCFSDDITWAQTNIKLKKNTIFVTWNTGVNSPIDMYLMSQCKNGIIANSTFSYWGALLGTKKNYIIYPRKWWNSKQGNPNIFFENWLPL